MSTAFKRLLTGYLFLFLVMAVFGWRNPIVSDARAPEFSGIAPESAAIFGFFSNVICAGYAAAAAYAFGFLPGVVVSGGSGVRAILRRGLPAGWLGSRRSRRRWWAG